MRRSLQGTAGALCLAVLLVGGCTRDDPSPTTAGGTAPVALDGSSGTTPGVVVPEPGTSSSTTAADPADPAATPTKLPGGAKESTVAPTLSSGRKLPDPQTLAVGWVDAKVTRGGSGPCYGITTDDGRVFAVYSAKPADLADGDRIRARLKPGRTPVNCGSGKAATLVRLLVRD